MSNAQILIWSFFDFLRSGLMYSVYIGVLVGPAPPCMAVFGFPWLSMDAALSAKRLILTELVFRSLKLGFQIISKFTTVACGDRILTTFTSSASSLGNSSAV
jgi:hypothetical protein